MVDCLKSPVTIYMQKMATPGSLPPSALIEALSNDTRFPSPGKACPSLADIQRLPKNNVTSYHLISAGECLVEPRLAD